MRRFACACALASFAGCGLISGLDNLVVDGGGPDGAYDANGDDALVDAATDAGGDVTIDAVLDVATLCENANGAPHCYGQSCPGSCCLQLPLGTITCGATCSPPSVPLPCTAPADCSNGDVCCLERVALTKTACPVIISFDASTEAVCAGGGSCSTTPGNFRVCVTDADCSPTEYCAAGELANSPKVTLGLCLITPADN